MARGRRGLGVAPELGATTETLTLIPSGTTETLDQPALIPSGAGCFRLSYSYAPRWVFLPLAARSLGFGSKYDSLSRDKRPGRGKCRK